MKKQLMIAVMAMTLAIVPFISCNKAGNVPNEEKLQLEAPSGERIAASASDLMKQTSAIIVEMFGKKQAFQITAVEYLNVSKGVAAIVTYELNDGTIYNYAVAGDANFTIASPTVSTRKPAKKSNDNTVVADESSSKVTLVCQKVPGGTCNCKIKGVVDVTTGVVTWSCNCQNDCEMVVIVS